MNGPTRIKHRDMELKHTVVGCLTSCIYIAKRHSVSYIYGIMRLYLNHTGHDFGF